MPAPALRHLRNALGLALALGLLSAAAAHERHEASERREGRERRELREERGEREPRLDLPDGRVVRPGQSVDLSWSAADDIRELEILLSTDGGRHYAVCISPQLDPGARHFTWRVPDVAGAELRLRIRFNRGGVEIEGPPTGPLAVGRAPGDRPEPLGLPPVVPGEPGPRSGSRAGAAAQLSATDAEGTEDAAPPATQAGTLLAPHSSALQATHSRRPPIQRPARTPQVVPLRT